MLCVGNRLVQVMTSHVLIFFYVVLKSIVRNVGTLCVVHQERHMLVIIFTILIIIFATHKIT
jgi:hypothetical protein